MLVSREVMKRPDNSMDRLIELGLDPQVYRISPFGNGLGEYVWEFWWGTVVYHLYGKTLVPLFMPKEGYLPKGYAASPSPWNDNSMI